MHEDDSTLPIPESNEPPHSIPITSTGSESPAAMAQQASMRPVIMALAGLPAHLHFDLAAFVHVLRDRPEAWSALSRLLEAVRERRPLAAARAALDLVASLRGEDESA